MRPTLARREARASTPAACTPRVAKGADDQHGNRHDSERDPKGDHERASLPGRRAGPANSALTHEKPARSPIR